MTSSLRFSTSTPAFERKDNEDISSHGYCRGNLSIMVGSKALSEVSAVRLSAASFFAHPRQEELINSETSNDTEPSVLEESAAKELAALVVGLWSDTGKHPVTYLVPDHPVHAKAIHFIPGIIDAELQDN